MSAFNTFPGDSAGRSVDCGPLSEVPLSRLPWPCSVLRPLSERSDRLASAAVRAGLVFEELDIVEDKGVDTIVVLRFPGNKELDGRVLWRFRANKELDETAEFAGKVRCVEVVRDCEEERRAACGSTRMC